MLAENSFPKQADCSLAIGFSGPTSPPDFRETGPVGQRGLFVEWIPRIFLIGWEEKIFFSGDQYTTDCKSFPYNFSFSERKLIS